MIGPLSADAQRIITIDLHAIYKSRLTPTNRATRCVTPSRHRALCVIDSLSSVGWDLL